MAEPAWLAHLTVLAIQPVRPADQPPKMANLPTNFDGFAILFILNTELISHQPISANDND